MPSRAGRPKEKISAARKRNRTDATGTAHFCRRHHRRQNKQQKRHCRRKLFRQSQNHAAQIRFHDRSGHFRDQLRQSHGIFQSSTPAGEPTVRRDWISCSKDTIAGYPGVFVTASGNGDRERRTVRHTTTIPERSEQKNVSLRF